MDVWLVVVGAVAAFGVARVVYADFLSGQARVKRELARRPRVRIGDAKHGMIRLTGRVRPLGEVFRAPVTRRPCAAFQVIVEMPDEHGGWKKVLELADARPFALVDESGEAVVDTAAGPLSIVLFPDRQASTRFRLSESEDLRAVRSLLVGQPKTFRYREGALLAGSKVSVAGYATLEVTPAGQRAGHREPPELLVVRGTAEQPMLISNWREAHGPVEG